MGARAFYGSAVRNIIFEEESKIPTLESEVFSECFNLINVVLPSGLKAIFDRAFFGCFALESITLPFVGASREADGYMGHVGYIFGYDETDNPEDFNFNYYDSGTEKYYYFYIPSSLKTIKILNTEDEIMCSAFSGCNSLESITLPFIGKNANATGYESHFGYIFGYSRSSSSSSNYHIKDGSYYYLYNIPTTLTKVEISGGINKVSKAAFRNCQHIESITLPDSVISIEEMAFAICYNLTELDLSDNIQNIEPGAFDYTGYYNNEKNWKNGVLYLGKHLIEAKEDLEGECKIEEGTLTIADEAFVRRAELTTIEIPNSVGYIGDYAFSDCSSLENLVMGTGIKNIGDEILENCSVNIVFLGAYNEYPQEIFDKYPYGAESTKIIFTSDDLDFLGFTFNGKHCYYDFGIYRVIDGDRYINELNP
jgi:hypothetical protein